MTDNERELPCIVFKLNGDKYALNVSHVIEITQVGEINVLPEMPPHLLGLFRFRDRVVPLVDLKTRLGLSGGTGETSADDERIIIVDDNGKWLGLKVDAIHEMVHMRESQFLDPEDGLANLSEAADGIYSLENDHILLLNYDAVIEPAGVINLANWKVAVGN